MPGYFSSLLTDHDHEISDYARHFQWLLDFAGNDGFVAPWGFRTVQRNTPCYKYSWDHGDCWNGPSWQWPYETSRVLTAIGNLLYDFSCKTITGSGMTANVFEKLFLQYARQYTRTVAENDTAAPKVGPGHIFENLHHDLDYWNNRALMYWRNDTNKDMGDDYNHSTLDLVFGSWLGIRLLTESSSPWLVLKSLIQAPYFAADRIPCKGRVLFIVLDTGGEKYAVNRKKLQGFVLLVDGQVVASCPDLQLVTIEKEPTLSEL